MIAVDYRSDADREKPSPAMQAAIDQTRKKMANAFGGGPYRARVVIGNNGGESIHD